jgi:hypothetical protein
VPVCNIIAEAQDLRFIGNVGDVGGDTGAFHALFKELFGLYYGPCGDIARGDIAARGNKLKHQLAADAGAATRNNCKPAGKIVHVPR